MSSSTPSASAISSINGLPKYRPVGVALAIGSGVLIGSSFVFKKKGLLSSQKGLVAGHGVAYLKSPLWWTGMTIMILGEICNLVAYSFLEAIIVTPMGALSVVVCAMLSHIVLKEKLSLFGWIASAQCILGATILALNGPQEQSVTTIAEFKKLFLAPGFLSYGSVVIVIAVVLAVVVVPRWGKRSMLPHICICSLIGGISVSCTQGLGACIVTSIRGENQFKNWFTYFILIFVIITLLTEIYYLNVALAMFNTAMVTPTYYVMFTFCTLLTSVILYQGLKASGSQIVTVVLGFFVICTGIFILQMSRVDPRELTHVDRRTTLLLQAARAEIDPRGARDLERDETNNPSRFSRRRTVASSHPYTGSQVTHTSVDGANIGVLGDELPFCAEPQALVEDPEEGSLGYLDLEEEARAVVEKTEVPGIDALRGTFGAIGTIVRARRRATALLVSSASIGTSSTDMANHPQSPTRSPRGTLRETCGAGAAVVEDGSDLEKGELRQAVFDSPVVTVDEQLLVASASSVLDARRVAGVRFREGDSAPPTPVEQGARMQG